MASIANVNVLETDLKQFFDEHKTFEVHAAMLAGTNIQEYKFPKKGILLIGNEGKGINDGLLPYVQQQITIPKLGKAESLNAAIATSIIVAHIKLS